MGLSDLFDARLAALVRGLGCCETLTRSRRMVSTGFLYLAKSGSPFKFC